MGVSVEDIVGVNVIVGVLVCRTVFVKVGAPAVWVENISAFVAMVFVVVGVAVARWKAMAGN